MSFASRLWAFVLLAFGGLGCQRVESVTPVADPTQTIVPSAFNGSKAGDEREVAGIKLCWCPPGKFTMGSPRTESERRPGENQVDVTLTKGFWMGKYEATQGQWKRVLGKLPGELTAELPEGDDYPVGNVNFAEVEAFCQKLTELGRQAGTGGLQDVLTRGPANYELPCCEFPVSEVGPRYNKNVIAPGAQTKRREDAGPVRVLLRG